VLLGTALVLHRGETAYDGGLPRTRAWFEIVDLSDPAAPRRGRSFDRGEALGHGQLLVFGTRVVASSVRALDADAASVAFFVDRLAIEPEEAPRLLAQVNVPGPIIAHDPASERAVAIEYDYETRPEATASDCYAAPKTVGYDYERLSCTLLHQRLALVEIAGARARRLGSAEVEGERRLLHAIGSSELVFALVGDGFGYFYRDGVVPPLVADVGVGVPADSVPEYTSRPIEIVTLIGLQDDALDPASRFETSFEQLDLYRAQARDRLLVVPSYGAGLAVFDASRPADPELSVHELYGDYCQDLSLAEDAAYCALGDYGMQAVALPE
jgi:hypothetical protein